MEVIDLQSSGIFKDRFKEGNLIEFYNCLLYDQYIHLRKFVHEFTSLFGLPKPDVRTDIFKYEVCESYYRPSVGLSDEHLTS